MPMDGPEYIPQYYGNVDPRFSGPSPAESEQTRADYLAYEQLRGSMDQYELDALARQRGALQERLQQMHAERLHIEQQERESQIRNRGSHGEVAGSTPVHEQPTTESYGVSVTSTSSGLAHATPMRSSKEVLQSSINSLLYNLVALGRSIDAQIVIHVQGNGHILLSDLRKIVQNSLLRGLYEQVVGSWLESSDFGPAISIRKMLQEQLQDMERRLGHVTSPDNPAYRTSYDVVLGLERASKEREAIVREFNSLNERISETVRQLGYEAKPDLIRSPKPFTPFRGKSRPARESSGIIWVWLVLIAMVGAIVYSVVNIEPDEKPGTEAVTMVNEDQSTSQPVPDPMVEQAEMEAEAQISSLQSFISAKLDLESTAHLTDHSYYLEESELALSQLRDALGESYYCNTPSDAPWGDFVQWSENLAALASESLNERARIDFYPDNFTFDSTSLPPMVDQAVAVANDLERLAPDSPKLPALRNLINMAENRIGEIDAAYEALQADADEVIATLEDRAQEARTLAANAPC